MSRGTRFTERGYKAAQERLLKAALEGNAWQADHIIPVYRGGGLCGLENLRTLCTPCHQDVTRAQAKDRAAARHVPPMLRTAPTVALTALQHIKHAQA